MTVPLRHLSPPGPAPASLSSGPFEPVGGVTAGSTGLAAISAGSFPPLVSLPVLGTLAVLLLTALGALATRLRSGDDPDGEPTAVTASAFGPSGRPPASSGDGDTLSADEEFVVDLLRAHGGRVRQSTIVDASEWSKSKVSRLLSSMERKGYVEKETIGRENAIVLSAEAHR